MLTAYGRITRSGPGVSAGMREKPFGKPLLTRGGSGLQRLDGAFGALWGEQSGMKRFFISETITSGASILFGPLIAVMATLLAFLYDERRKPKGAGALRPLDAIGGSPLLPLTVPLSGLRTPPQTPTLDSRASTPSPWSVTKRPCWLGRYAESSIPDYLRGQLPGLLGFDPAGVKAEGVVAPAKPLHAMEVARARVALLLAAGQVAPHGAGVPAAVACLPLLQSAAEGPSLLQ
eukprot:EG_transcript_23854